MNNLKPNNMKQTAVEWLIEQLTPSIALQQKYIDELKEQAKEMEKKQTAVEQLGTAFRQWQREWDNYDVKSRTQPKSFEEFINHFLEIEKQQLLDMGNQFAIMGEDDPEKYYNETFNKS